MVFAEVDVVAGHKVPHPAGPVLLLRLHGVGGVGHSAFGHRIGENALLLLRVVEAECGLDVESLEGVDIDICVAEESPVFVAVVFVAFETGQRVLAVGVAADRPGELAGGGVDRQRGIELQHILEESAGGLQLVGAVEGEMLTDGKDGEGLELGVDSCRETLEVGILDDTEVFVVAQREERAHLVGGAADGQVVVLYETGAGGLVKPVGVSSRCDACVVEIFVHRDGVEHRVARSVIAPVVTVSQAVGVGILSVVDIGLPHGLAEALGIEHLHTVGVELGGD